MCLSTKELLDLTIAKEDLVVYKMLDEYGPGWRTPFADDNVPVDGKMSDPKYIKTRPGSVGLASCIGTLTEPIKNKFTNEYNIGIGFHSYSTMYDAQCGLSRSLCIMPRTCRLFKAVIPKGTKYVCSNGQVVSEVLNIDLNNIVG